MSPMDDERKDGLNEEAAERRLKDLLREAVDPGPDQPVDMLGSVQRKLRERSGGKFYADRWSTTRYAPVSLFFVTSLLMLIAMAFLFLLLYPVSGRPHPVRNTPVPVQVVPPE